ncbi:MULTISPECIES: EF-hand domain-containing protein [unclassified Streptomyces]|uniref:EF-hand domain-containing protein n=1 Tax=unclassified Streptomyces TaxID=2593676 RepID=UPI0013BE5D51|nr:MULTISPECIES: EF-hand domain-containing protein [unclassified Streptomyces]MYX46869.1 calcium-binding protein [Streptomyces sp. SID89]NED37540.1 EF-hand domain-containing protein [Streptomyces sp. SID8499]NMO36503.1 EF-hand domain-containing protein [Streptomyces sp. GMY02]
MRTPEATDRVQLVFSLFDADGNGFLEADDFELMGSRVVAAAPAADDAAKQALLASFRRYWTTLVTELDANGDGKISPEEFEACVLSPERFEATIDEFARALSAIGDPEGDGFVNRPDFVALMTAIGFQRPNIEALFEAFGPVAGDRIPVATWAEGIRDYYRPEKAGIAGDHLTADGGR